MSLLIDEIHQQLPAHITPVKFDAYVDRLEEQAAATQRRALQTAQRAGFDVQPSDTPEDVASRREGLMIMALTDLMVMRG